MDKTQLIAELQFELMKQENWRPCMQKIAKKIGVSVSTIHDNFIRLKPRINIDIDIVPEYKLYEQNKKK
jgi:hypothetical protein